MKKSTGVIVFIALLIASYVVFKPFQGDEQRITQSEPLPSAVETIEQSERFVEKKGSFTYNNQKLQYLLIFPARYTQTATRWPLILFLHGSSLRGDTIERVKEYGPTWVAEQRTDFPFVVLAPQCPENEDWVDKLDGLAALLDEVFRKYRIDQERVYLTGTSLGGRGTWYLACKHPEYFAAIAPLAAATPVIPTAWHKQMLSMPIWAFHGEKDTIAPLKKDEAMVESLRRQGGTPRFTILPNEGHLIAGVYKNEELYQWFLSNKRQ